MTVVAYCWRYWPTTAACLTQNAKKTGYSLSAVGRQSSWTHLRFRGREQNRMETRNLCRLWRWPAEAGILSSTGCTPDDLCLCGVELQPIWLHPRSDVVGARRYLLLKFDSCCRTLGSVDLRVINVQVLTQQEEHQSERTDTCGSPDSIAATSEEDNRRRTYLFRPV